MLKEFFSKGLATVSMPRIELTGNRELVVSGADGIKEYENDRLTLFSGRFAVTAVGRDLVITSYNGEEAVVSGLIERLEFSF